MATTVSNLSCIVLGQKYVFSSIKEVLAKSNEEKSGDILAGISADSDAERVAAKAVLSELTLEQIRAQPVVPYEQDAVTRLIEDSINDIAWHKIKRWSVAGLREFLLSSDTASIDSIKSGLTGEIAAAVTKLMSNLDLIVAAKKCRVVATANTTLGAPNVLGARLQPNHPTDFHDGILASIFEGLSYGIGDAVIGINPVQDTAESVEALLHLTDDVIERLKVPTQNCILSHVSTQMQAIRKGAPAGLIFQSIAGTEKGNTAFGITIEMLQEARELGINKCKNSGKKPMYFETGQGSELSSKSNYDADQVTLEARCYALARTLDPFIVNDVCGFIGPEYLADGRQMIRAGLEDHFMGKLLGVPMGIDACYTNHMNADQNDLENLSVLLTTSGVNYFMGVPMGDDVMLGYQTTSFHDVASLRELSNLGPAPEFELWMEELGLMENKKLTSKAGDGKFFRQFR